jgi:glutamyl-tRNA reductase
MVLGEPQILGQVKRAYLAAREAGTTGTILERLLQQGLAAAKRVRSETGISRHAVSIAFAAVELARKIFGDLRGHAALLLGAGKMTELAARHLIAEGVRDVIVSNRTYSRAVALAERLGGRAVNWDDGFGCLASADIVVTGTAAPEPVLRKQTVQGYLRARRNRPLFLIDIAVPRDVEPSVNDLDNVYLYDIDDLQGVVDSNLEERKRQAATAQQMVDGEVEAFMRWRQSLDVSPTITALRNTLHGLSRKELERFRRKLGAINPEQEQALNDLLHAVVQKILHPTIVHLKKNAARGEGGDWAGLYREIFAIPDAEFETRDAGDTTPVPRTAGGED